MRIVLFTIDEMEFVPVLNGPLIKKYKDQIAAVYVSKSLFNFKKLFKKSSFFIKNSYPFCIKAGDLIRYLSWQIGLKIKGQRGSTNMVDYLKSQGLNAHYIEEINSEKTLRLLKEHNADIFLLSPFDKIAGEEFINIPKLGAFNVHLGKIPEHRGGLSAFWVLRFGDREAGVTMHRVIKKIDGGDIIAEIRFPVNTHSMHMLMKETVERASIMIVDAIDSIISGNVKKIAVDLRAEGYYLWPQRLDFKEFYAKGNKLF